MNDEAFFIVGALLILKIVIALYVAYLFLIVDTEIIDIVKHGIILIILLMPSGGKK